MQSIFQFAFRDRIARKVCFRAALLALVVWTAGPGLAAADELLLRDGGRIRGNWLNADEPQPRVYRFQNSSGVRVEIAAARVRSARLTTALQREYQRKAAACEETPDALWALAQWCRDNELKPERREQLRRILLLSPDDVRARRGLGYSQVDGQWVTQASYFRAEGYQLYQGRWLAPQEVVLLKEKEAVIRRQKGWYARLKRGRKQLATGPDPDAMRLFQEVNDPEAVWGLMELWSQESSPWARRAYAAALVGIPTAEALTGLVRIALHDPDPDVFLECMKRLKVDTPGAVVDACVKALKSPHNAQVNRAAQALAQFRDPSTVDALISALVTHHHFVVGQGSKDKMSSTFMQDGAGGGGSAFNTGDDRKLVRRTMTNQDVLSALVAITGHSFGFNQKQWSAWWDVHRAQTRGKLLRAQTQ